MKKMPVRRALLLFCAAAQLQLPVCFGQAPGGAADLRKITSLPLAGDVSLAELLRAYDLSSNDVLPHSGETLGTFLADNAIKPAATILKIDPVESVDQRLRRWDIDPAGPISVDTPAKFRVLVLATLESYFRLHAEAVPAASESPLDTEDRFAGALFRETWGHDIYTNSLTRPGSEALIDGSVLFETAFAPIETVNLDLIGNKALLLSHLEMIRLDEADGLMNGAEQKRLAAEIFDRVAGTRYAAAVARCSPSLTALIDVNALHGHFKFPVAFADAQDLANRNHVPVVTFIRALVVFHALAAGGVRQAASDPPNALKRMILRETQGALSQAHPKRFEFGFITSLFDSEVKQKLKIDADAMTPAGVGPFLSGDAAFPGVLGPGGFLDQILFKNYGVSCLPQ